MNFLARISPEWSLRIGLGTMYLYSGVDLILHPRGWYWALPYWLKQTITAVMPLDLYLKVQGAGEIVLALVLLAWFVPRAIVKWAAILSALEMAVILLLGAIPWSPSVFLTTFRDFGLLGASLALSASLSREDEIHNP